MLLAKLVPEFSVGDEYSGATIFVDEYSTDSKQGFIVSWLDFGSIAGFVFGAGIVVLISSIASEQNFLDCGWQIPLFLAALLGIVGLYLHNAAEEAPTFQQHMDKMEYADLETLKEQPRLSMLEAMSKHWRGLPACAGLVSAINVTYYMLLAYIPTNLSRNLHDSEDHGVLTIVAIMVGMLFVQPVIRLWGDKVGRKPFVIGGNIGLFILVIPRFSLINSNVLGLIFPGLLLLNAFIGVMDSTLPAIYPTTIRYSTLTISFNISVLIAGLVPTTTIWLVESTSIFTCRLTYLMVIAVIELATGIFMRETANWPLKGTKPSATDRVEDKEILQERYDDIEQQLNDIDTEI